MRTLLLATASLALLASCGPPCSHNSDCDDGLFCNGQETCSSGHCAAGTPPACDDGVACTVDVCNENTRACNHRVPDVDGDGHGDAKCIDSIGVSLGDDCDDNDPNRFPSNREVCDPSHDEDCDLATLGGTDSDSDGYVSSACGNTLEDGGVLRGLDCDDADPGVHPGQLEACNGVDDNCNGQVDEGVKVSRYADLDGDGYGAGPALSVCATDPMVSAFDDDCDDTNPAMHPGAFACVPGGQPNQVSLCELDGGFSNKLCAAGNCVTQPNGIGACL